MKIRSRVPALAAAFVLLALTARPDAAYGAAGIDTERTDCSMRFDLSGNYQTGAAQEMPDGGERPLPEDAEYVRTDGYEELQDRSLTVELYKAADVDAGGRYQEPKSGDQTLYQALKAKLEAVNADTKAAEWLEMARTAEEKAAELALPAVRTAEISASDAVVDGLSTGLYLVSIREVTTEESVYTFTPYLVSLPGYERSGGEESWNYTDVEVGLKAGREPRYAKLAIEKTLKTWNESAGGASFVFHVKAEKDRETVYNNVLSLLFTDAGTRRLEISGKIPAGSSVTVTEVYSGAGYVPVSAKVQTIERVSAYDGTDPQSVSVVRFVNDYDGRSLNTGTSVVNHFTYSVSGAEGDADAQESWDWKPLADSAVQAAGGEQ